MIVFGLYMVLWGKGKEMKKLNQLAPSESSPGSDLTDIVITSRMEVNDNIARVKFDGLSTPISPGDDNSLEKRHEENEGNHS